MKRTVTALLALCMLLCMLLAGCAKKTDAPVAPATPPEPVPPPSAPAPQAPKDDGAKIYAVDGLEVPVPAEYADLIVADTELEAWDKHWEPLISFAEKESVEQGKRAHPDEDWGDGALCTLVRLDRIGFEKWISEDGTGTDLFARDDADNYYLVAHPTDVRLFRESGEYDDETIKAWTALNEWAGTLPEAVIARNGLTAYDAGDLFGADYTYAGEHVELACRFPGEAMDCAILSLSQPVKQGEEGVWCVERVRFVYSAYDWTDTQLVFPAALGVDRTAADYYAQLQKACDAGEHPELLTPRGAALDYARRVAWIFGEDVSASDFELVEAVG